MSNLAKGTRLGPGGRFEIRELIGRGGWAEVYEALDHNLHCRVALKTLHEHKEHAIERFRAEAMAAARICDSRRGREYVVNVIYVSSRDDGDPPFFVMELLQGRNLNDVLRDGRMEPALATDVLLGACLGMAEAHACGVIHRDLSLGNIFVLESSPGVMVGVKIIDFGVALSSAAVRRTAGDRFLGTLLYSAPERFDRKEDALSDQYSLAAVLFHAIAGHPPFHDDRTSSLALLMGDIKEGRVRSIRASTPNLNSKLADVIVRAMSHNPAQRYPSVLEFGRALLPFASDDWRGEYTRKFRASQAAPRVAAPLSEQTSTMLRRIAEIGGPKDASASAHAETPANIDVHQAVTAPNPSLANKLLLSEAPTAAYRYPSDDDASDEAPAAGSAGAARARRALLVGGGLVVLLGALWFTVRPSQPKDLVEPSRNMPPELTAALAADHERGRGPARQTDGGDPSRTAGAAADASPAEGTPAAASALTDESARALAPAAPAPATAGAGEAAPEAPAASPELRLPPEPTALETATQAIAPGVEPEARRAGAKPAGKPGARKRTSGSRLLLDPADRLMDAAGTSPRRPSQGASNAKPAIEPMISDKGAVLP